MGYADLHVHSFYSDGTMSPREIAEAAKAAGVSLVAVADHNVLDGSREMKTCCERAGIGYIPAVELDSLDNGKLQHILGYGVDLESGGFVSFVKRNRAMLDEMSVILVGRMSGDYPCLSPEDFESFSYDKKLGGWKALQYFMAKGLTQSLKQGIAFYNRYDVPYSAVGFPSVAEVCAQVRLAQGHAVLAHPGEMIDQSNVPTFLSALERLAGYGLDGVECYYPTHTAEITAVCVGFCRGRGLLITSGSDCHGGFGKTAVGEMRIPVEMLELGGLVSPV